MTPDITPDFTASAVIQRIGAGELPREFLLSSARGFLPLPQDEVIAVLAYLTSLDDEEVAATARQTLSEFPARTIVPYIQRETDSVRLNAVAGATNDPAILEAVLRNRYVTDDQFVALAARVGPMLQELVVINQERILRCPAILDSLLANPGLSPDVRRRALEVREEFFEKRKAEQPPPEPIPSGPVGEEDLDPTIDLAPVADLLEKAEAMGDVPLPTLQPPEKLDEANESIFFKIMQMTAGQRVQRAFRGGRTERLILIRDRNKIVCTAVIRSPRITEAEVESIAGMRNIEEEVLRIIGMSREWMSKYHIMLTLLRNPKAPIGVVLPLINRLTLRDLKALGSDRNVSETIRTMARKTYTLRTQK